MIFINYINDSKLLFNLLYQIYINHPEAIIIGNHYLKESSLHMTDSAI